MAVAQQAVSLLRAAGALESQAEALQKRLGDCAALAAVADAEAGGGACAVDWPSEGSRCARAG